MKKPVVTQRPYAYRTKVPIAVSRADIEKILTRHKASAFASAWTKDGAAILFEAFGRRVRFNLKLLPADQPENENENRRRWRCLAFIIKAKFEALDSGLVTFDQEFLSHIVVPGKDGETIGDWLGPQLAAAYERGASLPPLLGSAS